MLLRIDHETRLTYSEPVAQSVITLRMAPSSGDDQTVMHYRLRTTPPVPVTNIRDGFGNRVALLIAACRGVGLPARYVSGYVNHPGELATHAWVQVWGGPAVGWVDIDPTHDVWPAEDHIVTAVGRDYADVPPNRGVWKGTAAET